MKKRESVFISHVLYSWMFISAQKEEEDIIIIIIIVHVYIITMLCVNERMMCIWYM